MATWVFVDTGVEGMAGLSAAAPVAHHDHVPPSGSGQSGDAGATAGCVRCRAAATCIALTSRSRSRGWSDGTTTPRAATTSEPGTDRDRDRAGAQRHLLDRRGVAVRDDRGDLATHPRGLADRVGSDPRQGRQHRLLHVGRRVGQQHLADPRRVQRQPRADRADDRHRRVAGEPVDVQRLEAVADSEVHGGEGRAVEVVEVGRGQLAEPGVHRREQADVPQPAADDVLPRRRAGQRAPGDQLADEPVGGRDGQPGAGRELGQREPAVARVERAEQRQRAARHREPGACRVACHADHASAQWKRWQARH